MENEEKIWRWLKEHTALSDEAAAGILGNFEAESNCESCRVQGDFSSDRSDSLEYARKVDSGEISASYFANDGKGWGIYQLTYYSRKAGFLSYCKEKGYSIADLEAQLEFMLTEDEWKAIEARMLKVQGIYEAAELFCKEFEKPAICNSIARANYGQGFYALYHKEEEEQAQGSGVARALELMRQAVEVLEQMCN